MNCTCSLNNGLKMLFYLLSFPVRDSDLLVNTYHHCLFTHQLLAEPRFNCIEKIKTIGETYMAASGIKPESQVS